MAKRKQPHIPSQPRGQVVDLASTVKSAEGQSDAPRTYANHAQFSITTNEIFIDLYRLEPNITDPAKPKAFMVERVVIPLSLAKGFASALANVVDGFERETKIKIPNNRSRDPRDTIVLWKDDDDNYSDTNEHDK